MNVQWPYSWFIFFALPVAALIRLMVAEMMITIWIFHHSSNHNERQLLIMKPLIIQSQYNEFCVFATAASLAYHITSQSWCFFGGEGSLKRQHELHIRSFVPHIVEGKLLSRYAVCITRLMVRLPCVQGHSRYLLKYRQSFCKSVLPQSCSILQRADNVRTCNYLDFMMVDDFLLL